MADILIRIGAEAGEGGNQRSKCITSKYETAASQTSA